VEIPATEIDEVIWKFERPLALIGIIFVVLQSVSEARSAGV